MRSCSNCGCPIDEGMAFCPDCGHEIVKKKTSVGEVFCGECGRSIPDNSAECPYCGALMEGSDIIECEACGSKFTSINSVCPNCGSPVKDDYANNPQSLGSVQPQEVADAPSNEYKEKNLLITTTIVLFVLSLIIWALLVFIIKYDHSKAGLTAQEAQDEDSLVIEYPDTDAADTVDFYDVSEIKPDKTSLHRNGSGTNNASNPYEWLMQRHVTSADFSGLSKAELRILRNAIYAQHGYRFKDPALLKHFSQFSWYVPTSSNVEGSLSEIDRYNITTIKS